MWMANIKRSSIFEEWEIETGAGNKWATMSAAPACRDAKEREVMSMEALPCKSTLCAVFTSSLTPNADS